MKRTRSLVERALTAQSMTPNAGGGRTRMAAPRPEKMVTLRTVALIAPPFLKFNLNGTLSVSASDEDPMGFAGKLILVAARLKTSGSSTTTAILKHTTADGATTTSVATFSFTSGNETPTTTPSVGFSFLADDYWWVDVTAAGTGAAGLVVSGWGTAA
jgi:hypothetical protein